MRLKKDLERLHESRENEFGYVDITVFNCPPFVMFTNNMDCGICGAQMQGWVYEPQSTYLWSGLVALATSVFDIGTRCGEYSLIAAALREDIPIVSCEPNPDGFARLQINMLANEVKNMRLHRVAVGNASGFTYFGWPHKSPGHISSGGRMLGERRTLDPSTATQVLVEVAPLDEIIKNVEVGDRPVMKIDVEGAEKFVFEGMPRLLERKPDIILESFSAEACDYITEVTRSLGYNYFHVNESEQKVSQRDRLYPARGKGNFNQLLTTRSPQTISELT